MVETLFVLNVVLCGHVGCVDLTADFPTLEECSAAVTIVIERVIEISKHEYARVEFTDPPCVLISTWEMES